MKPARLFALALFAAIAASVAGQAQTATTPTAPDNKALADQPPVEIVSHKIGPEYYPMLDRPGMIAPPMTAETGDIPRAANEPIARRNRGRFSVPPEERRAHGRLRSDTRVIDNPQLIQVVIKNTGAKQIKVIEWDFMFPHCENGRIVPRYDATTRVKINPGGKKTLKRRLSPVASGCVMPKVISIDEIQKQERISIKRIEYVDGSVWQRQ
jgi:hypothetical protein